MPPLYLSSCSLRNRLGNNNPFGDLELGNLPIKSLLYPLLFRRIITAVSRLEDDPSPDNLAILGVLNPKAYSFSHTID